MDEEVLTSPRTLRTRTRASMTDPHVDGAPPAAASAEDDERTTESTALKRLRKVERDRFVFLAAALVLCAAAATAAVVFRKAALRACAWIGRQPPAPAGALYAIFLAVWLFCLLPTSLLEIAAGFLFGFWRAFAFSTLGKTTGSLASFGVGRFCREGVRARFLAPPDEGGSSSRGSYLRGLELALKLEPFKTCLALRLAYLPEAVQNYVPAVFDAPPGPFVVATALGSALYAALWAKLGSQLSSAADIGSEAMSPERAAFLGIGFVSLLAVFLFIHWNTKKTIARFQSLQRGEDPPPQAADPGRPSGLV